MHLKWLLLLHLCGRVPAHGSRRPLDWFLVCIASGRCCGLELLGENGLVQCILPPPCQVTIVHHCPPPRCHGLGAVAGTAGLDDAHRVIWLVTTTRTTRYPSGGFGGCLLLLLREIVVDRHHGKRLYSMIGHAHHGHGLHHVDLIIRRGLG